MNALAIYALAACDIFTAVVQGFYWRLPENNLVGWSFALLVLCNIWPIYISYLEFLALSDMFWFNWCHTNNIVRFPFQDFWAAILCASVYRYNTWHGSYSKHIFRRKWWGGRALQHLGFFLIQPYNLRGGKYILNSTVGKGTTSTTIWLKRHDLWENLWI